ncbi:MAG: hypothetical protein WAT79_06395 [Saprospiraceae bacterium]
MRINVVIHNVKTVNELPYYWSQKDYITLLEDFNFPDADKIKPDEMLDFLYMAIADFEPAEAAEILLKYKLSDRLNEGQIQNISHEMKEDKVAEEYPDPSFHFDLFNINQLLYKAYNGTFPNIEASIIELEMLFPEGKPEELTKEIWIKTLAKGLSDSNLVNRLFSDQLDGTEPFSDAWKVIWFFREKGDNQYEVITSRYWIEKSDFQFSEYEADIFMEEVE